MKRQSKNPPLPSGVVGDPWAAAISLRQSDIEGFSMKKSRGGGYLLDLETDGFQFRPPSHFGGPPHGAFIGGMMHPKHMMEMVRAEREVMVTVDLVRVQGDAIDVITLTNCQPLGCAILLNLFYETEEQVDHLFAFGAAATGFSCKPDYMEWEDDSDESQKGLPLDSYATEAQITFVNRDGKWFRLPQPTADLKTDGIEITRDTLLADGGDQLKMTLSDRMIAFIRRAEYPDLTAMILSPFHPFMMMMHGRGY